MKFGGYKIPKKGEQALKQTYDRAIPVANSTMALQRFAADFTALNSYYWGATSSIAAVGGVLRHLNNQDDFRAKLGLTQSRFDRPLNHRSGQFADELGVSEKWHRRAALVALLSAFERYMATVTALAVASDPSLIRGFPKLIEGLSLQKHGVKLGERDLESVVKGTWGGRLAAYERLFGPNPTLAGALGELEKMRNSRNRIAHVFAASEPSTALSPHAALIVGTRRLSQPDNEVSLSEKKLLSWFDLTDQVVKAVDKQLLTDFIGNYEVAAMYLEWHKDAANFEAAVGLPPSNKQHTHERRTKKFLANALGRPPMSGEYVRSIISFTATL